MTNIKALITGMAAMLLSGCASGPLDPLEEARAWAWIEHPHNEVFPDKWEANVNGDCVGKAYALKGRLEPLGYKIMFLDLVCRRDLQVCDERQSHFVAVASRHDTNGWVVIDFDRNWPIGEYPMTRGTFVDPNP